MTKAELADAIKNTMEANNMKDSYIRLVVTRGVGKLGLDPNKCATPQIIIITDTIELYSKALYEKDLMSLLLLQSGITFPPLTPRSNPSII